MSRSKIASVMVIMACVAGLNAGAVRADEPTSDQLKEQITQLQSQVQALAARVEQLESAQAESESSNDIDPEQVSQTTRTTELAQPADATAIDAVTTVSNEAAAESAAEPVVVDHATKKLPWPFSEESVAPSRQSDEHTDADDAAPDIEDATAAVEEARDVLEKHSDEIAAVSEDQTETDTAELAVSDVAVEALTATRDETVTAALNPEVSEPVMPATQPAAAASVDQSATAGRSDEHSDVPALAQIDQAPLDEVSTAGVNP